MKLQVTPVFHKLSSIYQGMEYRQITAMGGSRSSKSWSILQLFVTLLVSREKLRITCWRNEKVTCRSTILVDFRNILYSDVFLYNMFIENKSRGEFMCKRTGSVIIFEGADNIGKVLGMTQTISFFNEITEFNEAVYLQITQRTAETIFVDYNPSKNFWYEKYQNDPRTIFTHSTYRDNPFCPPEIVTQLNGYDPSKPENVAAGTANQYMFDVYCEGLRAEKPNKIYQGWKTIPSKFFDRIPADSYYALDFGLSSPCALVEIKYDGVRTFYVRELMYLPGNQMTTTIAETIHKKFPRIKNNSSLLIADSAKKVMVDDLSADGFSAVGAIKGPGSIDSGISFCQSVNISYTDDSDNIDREYELYSFQVDRNGNTIDTPERNQDDHLMDAIRYGLTYLKIYLGINENN